MSMWLTRELYSPIQADECDVVLQPVGALHAKLGVRNNLLHADVHHRRRAHQHVRDDGTVGVVQNVILAKPHSDPVA